MNLWVFYFLVSVELGSLLEFCFWVINIIFFQILFLAIVCPACVWTSVLSIVYKLVAAVYVVDYFSGFMFWQWFLVWLFFRV